MPYVNGDFPAPPVHSDDQVVADNSGLATMSQRVDPPASAEEHVGTQLIVAGASSDGEPFGPIRNVLSICGRFDYLSTNSARTVTQLLSSSFFGQQRMVVMRSTPSLA